MLRERFATCLVATLDPATGEGRVASCGHPPLAIVTDAGRVELADVALRPPLGTPFERAADHDAPFTLEPGGSLVLYTDGLIERRREVIDRGLERLVATAGRPGTAEERCDALVAACRDPESADDATVLVVCRGG
jgi:serine phosphatase RsbU (regulator of sigma subunit)